MVMLIKLRKINWNKCITFSFLYIYQADNIISEMLSGIFPAIFRV